jgi:hypothetical protein
MDMYGKCRENAGKGSENFPFFFDIFPIVLIYYFNSMYGMYGK